MRKSKPKSNLRTLLESNTVGSFQQGAYRPSGWRPPFDLRVNANEIAIFVDIPGMDEDDIQISSEANTIKISGVREFDHDAEDPEEYVRMGRPYGPLACEIHLAEDFDFARATAKYLRGVLKVRVPLERSTSKPIPIQYP